MIMYAFDFDSDFVPLPEPSVRERLRMAAKAAVGRLSHWLGLSKKDQVPHG